MVNEATVGRRGALATAFLLLVALVFAVHHPVLSDWWAGDDSQILVHASRYGPLEILISPEAWGTLSTSSFTPWVTLSFQFDIAMAGLSPVFFYAHQLVAVGLAAGMLALLLARFVRLEYAVLGSIAFAVAPLTALVTRSLMLRHYAEGLVFALCALVAFDSALSHSGERRRALPRMFLACAAFVLAMLSKEFFFPLPALFLLLGWHRRIPPGRLALHLVGPVIAAVVVVAWRTRMLGGAGGYSGTPDPVVILGGMGRAITGGNGTLAAVSAALFTLLILPVLVRNPRGSLVVAATVAAFLLPPLFGVGDVFEPRYGFVATATLIAILVVACAAWNRRLTAGLALAGLALAAGLSGASASRVLASARLPEVAEGRYVYERDGGSPALLARSAPWYLSGLEWLREHAVEPSTAPRYVFSVIPMATGEIAPSDVVTVEGSALRKLGVHEYREIRDLASKLDGDLPMDLEVWRQRNSFVWQFGPPASGGWSLVSVPEHAVYALAPSGQRRLPASVERQWFRVRRELPDGTWGLSDALPVPGDGERFTWSRGEREVAAREASGG